MEQLTKQEKALAIATSKLVGWRLFSEDKACPDESIYKMRRSVWETEESGRRLAREFSTYEGLMSIRDGINATTKIQINMFGGHILLEDGEENKVLEEFLFYKGGELNALLDAVYSAIKILDENDRKK